MEKIQKMHLFDDGWNKLRERIFANQKRLGIIPQVELSPWPKEILKEWDACSAEEKKLFIRQVETFAAFAAYNDHRDRSVIQAVEEMGELDNTLIIYIDGDNGTSTEGGLYGTPNEVAFFNGVTVPVEAQMKWYDVWGTAQTYNHMSAYWAWAFDTPFSWFKQIASHLGGVRQGMCISWPAGIEDRGSMRNQFTHVIDVVPTILEVTGIAARNWWTASSRRQSRERASLTRLIRRTRRPRRSGRRTAVFRDVRRSLDLPRGLAAEHQGDAAAVGRLGAVNPDPVNNVSWELYHLEEDFSQVNDVAAQHPDKVAELKKLFLSEARKYNVLPLGRVSRRRGRSARGRTSPRGATSSSTRLHRWLACRRAIRRFLNSSYTITAEIDVPAAGIEGMILTSGGRFAGYGFYLLKGKPVFLWNLIDLERVKWEGPEASRRASIRSSSTSSTKGSAWGRWRSTTSAGWGARGRGR